MDAPARPDESEPLPEAPVVTEATEATLSTPAMPPEDADHPVQQLIFLELKLILEALLFTSQKPLSVGELRDLLTQSANEEGAAEGVRALRKLPASKLESALSELAQDHEAAARSFRLVCIAGAWQFVTQTEYAPWLRAMLGVKARPSRLSQAALETLAIIAYRQPITRAEMEQIRGVAVDGTITTLLERQLIQQAGRAEVLGRPMQYATTADFLAYFGLASLDALPAADELRRIPVQRPEVLATADPILPTAEPPAPEQLTLDQAESAGAGAPTVDAEVAAPEAPTDAPPPAADAPADPAS